MFKEKADTLTAEAAVKRGYLNPSPDSFHMRIYKWWLSTDPSITPSKENLCHYMRVVLIWAPLLWIALNVLRPVEWLVDKFSRDKKYRTPFSVRHPLLTNIGQWLLVLAGCALALVGIGGLVYAFITTPKPMFIGLSIFVGCFAVALALVAMVGHFEDKRRARREAWREGEISDEEYFGKPKVKKAPGRISKFFHGIYDFAYLIFQYVRTKKWKICPFVEIPEEI